MMRPQFRTPILLLGLLCLQAFAYPSAPLGYEPSLQEIIVRSLRDRTYFSRAIIETESAVFDPYSKGQEADSATGSAVRTPGVGANETVPAVQEEKAFRQVSYWLRNKFLAVETFSMEGELLHFYLREALARISINLTENRLFSDIDVLNPYFPFIEDNRENWQEGLDRWGLQPAEVSLVRASKGRVYFQLAEAPGKSLWLDRKRYLPVRINTLVEGGSRPLAITIEFTEFLLIEGEEKQLFAFPRTINHLLDGTLFKQTTVTGIRVNTSWRRFPLTRLRKKGRELAEKGESPNAQEGKR